MTWSLRLENGDLVKGPGNNLDTISGPDKVVQDLICWIKEPFGTDPLNPELGSFIEIGEEGTAVMIGGQAHFFSEDYAEMVMSELQRIISGYQTTQIARLKTELQKYNGLYTFANDEIIESFNIFYEVYYDTLFVNINLEMVSGDFFTVTLPVEAPSNLQTYG